MRNRSVEIRIRIRISQILIWIHLIYSENQKNLEYEDDLDSSYDFKKSIEY